MTERDNLIFRRTEMYNFNEDAIREAAYYIWKNNRIPTSGKFRRLRSVKIDKVKKQP